MEKPEVIQTSGELVPEGSNAINASLVRMSGGETTVVELFEEDSGRYYDFRGLPEHLGDSGDMWVTVAEPVRPLLSGIEAIDFHKRREAREKQVQLLFEFAIGARQSLWAGAEVHYADETYNPTSRHYKAFR